MKKYKKGFTLVELLAVIVILSIIMVIAGTNLMDTKKEANKEEAIKMEQMIKDLGPLIYADEKLRSSDGEFMKFFNSGDSFYITVETLKEANYLKGDIKNPNGNGTCDGYLLIEPSDDSMFKGYISCPNLYTSDDFETAKTTCTGGKQVPYLEWNKTKKTLEKVEPSC